MRVDEATIGQRRLELAPQLAHVDVHGAVAGAQLAAPHRPVELFAGDDRAEPSSHRHEQFELAYRQRERHSRRQHEALVESDLELTGVQDVSGDVGALGHGGHDAQRRSWNASRRCKLVI